MKKTRRNSEAEQVLDLARIKRVVVANLRKHGHLLNADAGRMGLLFDKMARCGLLMIDTLPAAERYTPDEIGTALVIAEAKAGDGIAHEALRNVARHLTDSGDPLPLPLQRYLLNSEITPPKSTTSTHPMGIIYRDDVIYRSVLAAKAEGLPSTRNRKAKHNRPSACSLVAEVLGLYRMQMSEAAVESIFEGRRQAHERAAPGRKMVHAREELQPQHGRFLTGLAPARRTTKRSSD